MEKRRDHEKAETGEHTHVPDFSITVILPFLHVCLMNKVNQVFPSERSWMKTTQSHLYHTQLDDSVH